MWQAEKFAALNYRIQNLGEQFFYAKIFLRQNFFTPKFFYAKKTHFFTPKSFFYAKTFFTPKKWPWKFARNGGGGPKGGPKFSAPMLPKDKTQL